MSDIENIKKLRQSTGAGFKDCNAALKESNGNLDKAAEILRVKGIAKASKKMSRDAKEGVIVVSGDINKTSLIEVNCETDFVAKNEDFIKFVKELSEINNICSSNLGELNKSKMSNSKTVEENLVSLIAKIGSRKITIGKLQTIENKNSQNFIYQHSVIKENVSKLGVVVSIEASEKSEQIKSFGKQLSMHIAASNPLALNSNEIQKEILDKEQQLIAEELKNSGKPEEIAKISLGKLNKFKEENSLMTQDWVMEPKKKVKDIISEINIPSLKIKEFIRLKIGD